MKLIKTLLGEIPYERESHTGYILGVLMAVALYVIVPIFLYKDFIVVTYLMLAIDTFYAFIGLMKYLLKLNRPNNLLFDLLLNYCYFWRRSH